MLSSVIVAAGAAVLSGLQLVAADQCALGSTQIDGNYFCQSVQAIRYSNVGAAGTYKQVIKMTGDGKCESTPKRFSGPLSPLDEEVSLHFRGPLHLKQIAAYTPVSNNKRKRRARGEVHHHVHNHANLHEKKKEGPEPDMVTATIDGKVVSWENNWFGEVATQTGSVAPQMVTATIDGVVVSWVNNWFGHSATATGTSIAAATSAVSSNNEINSASASPQAAKVPGEVVGQASSSKSPSANFHGPDASGTYERVGFYHSESQTVENLVFLGNHGGQGSGVFDYKFGASLAYANKAGTGGADGPQILADATIPSDSEVIIMLGEDCSDGGCGYTRPGAVAHHGFDGADKVFLMEFSMPMDGTKGFNGDMPAIWMLNAQIPRTLQYGDSECSCWKSGCGEFDIAEALSSGSTYLKSTLHTNRPGGDSDYLLRPTTGTMKLAVIFDSSEAAAHIQVLSGNTEFPANLSAADIKKFCSDTAASKVSHFHVA